MTTIAPIADSLAAARAALDAPTDHCQVVELPPISYLAIDGLGPPDAPAFTDAVHAVYGITYALRDLLRAEGVEIGPIMPLEAIWRSHSGEPWRPEAPHEWNWSLMIAQPAEVTRDHVRAVRETARAKRHSPAVDRARLELLDDGPVGQILHVGPYIAEWPTIARLHAELRCDGFEAIGPHHEIYLDNPRQVPEAEVRTIIRQRVRRA